MCSTTLRYRYVLLVTVRSVEWVIEIDFVVRIAFAALLVVTYALKYTSAHEAEMSVEYLLVVRTMCY